MTTWPGVQVFALRIESMLESWRREGRFSQTPSSDLTECANLSRETSDRATFGIPEFRSDPDEIDASCATIAALAFLASSGFRSFVESQGEPSMRCGECDECLEGLTCRDFPDQDDAPPPRTTDEWLERNRKLFGYSERRWPRK